MSANYLIAKVYSAEYLSHQLQGFKRIFTCGFRTQIGEIKEICKIFFLCAKAA